jgi:Fe-S oxidoreductase
VLEAAGCQVAIPEARLCCGRPLYDYGMLGLARTLLLEILERMRADIEAGVPVVGLEPSCVAVFRDELTNLLPDHANARRLQQQTFLLSEFLVKRHKGYTPPPLHGRAILHGHCHQKAIMKMQSDTTLLSRMGLEVELLDSGCCGMAGGFGYEADHYEISIKAGERVLLPAVRRAPAEALIVTDGFSCREQIAQTTHRRALHTAEVLAIALRRGPEGAGGPYPESDAPSPEWNRASSAAWLVGLAGLAATGLAVLARGRRVR